MATLRARPARDRKGKLRPYFSIRLRGGLELGVGRDERIAKLLLAEYTLREEFERHGVKIPERSAWRLQDLTAWDMKCAEREGGETASRARRWRVLERELGAETPIEEITAALLQAVIDRRRAAGASARTVNRDLSVLRKALRRAREPRSGSLYTGDPFLGIAPERESGTRPSPRRREEVDAILEAARRRGAADPELAQDAQIAELLYLTGSRKSQIMRLRRDQVIDLPAGRVLRFAGHKRGRERLFHYRGRLAEILEAIPDDGSGWYFPSKRLPGKPRSEFRRFLEGVAKAAGVPRFTAHALRHSKSSALLAAGLPISRVQSELGHVSRRTTEEEYAELFPEVLEAARPPASPAPIPARGRKGQARRGRRRKRALVFSVN